MRDDLRRQSEGLPGTILARPVNRDTAQIEADKIAVLVDLRPRDAQALQAAAWWHGVGMR